LLPLLLLIVVAVTVLEKYRLKEFVSLVDSVRKGDLRTFNESVEEYQDRFIRYVYTDYLSNMLTLHRSITLTLYSLSLDPFHYRQGTYLLLEKCKTVCYRNLIKRIHSILDKPQIPLQTIAKTFAWLKINMDLDEIECILASLIYTGFIRGYLAHTRRILVLSKRDPFPVSAVIAK
jgi:nuclear mRNA export protein PCID2/THP1